MSTRRVKTAMKKNSIPFRHLREAYAIFNKTNGKSPHTVAMKNLSEPKILALVNWSMIAAWNRAIAAVVDRHKSSAT
jgi:hypothetical protein